MVETNKYILELTRAISHFAQALEDGERWVSEDGEGMWVRLTKEVIPRPLVYGWSLRCEHILDELCQGGKDNIPFFVERLKDKGILWIKREVEQFRGASPTVGGRYGEELASLRERIDEMACALFATVRRAEGIAKMKGSILGEDEHDIEEMRMFFNPRFNGRERGEIDHFQFDFLPAWRSRRNMSAKDYARVAFLIHDSQKWAATKVKHSTFQGFYAEFCKVAGCKYSGDYKPSKLRDDIGDFAESFYFLKNR